MKKYIIFYSLDLDYNKVLIEAKSLKDAVATADAFSRKTGAIVVGVCLELLVKVYSYGL
jgi:hypothetical protein